MIFEPQIIYEDQFIVCINKPAGLLSIRHGYDPTLPYVTRLLEPRYGRLWIVHRLDRDTSGIMVLARTRESHTSLNDAFEKRQVRKTYHAIVNGHPDWEEHMADLPLRINGDRSHRTVINPLLGKPAQTIFRVLKSSPDFSLVEARPLTGYTHQIRAHLLALGFPIIADLLYSPQSRPQPISVSHNLPISRLALHAYCLDFRHPATGEEMHMTAPYPADFLNALKALSLF